MASTWLRAAGLVVGVLGIGCGALIAVADAQSFRDYVNVVGMIGTGCVFVLYGVTGRSHLFRRRRLESD
jgi:hypothetical protein